MKKLLLVLSVFLFVLISNLASAGDDGKIEINKKNNGYVEATDCFEKVNRGIFAFNQVVDKAIDTWYCGIGVKKGNASLQQWLNVALYTLHRADFVDETWEKWFGIRQIHSVQPQPYF